MKDIKLENVLKVILEVVFYSALIITFCYSLYLGMYYQNAGSWVLFSAVIIVVIHQKKDDIELRICCKNKKRTDNFNSYLSKNKPKKY